MFPDMSGGAAIPARRERKRRGFCVHCDYDLTGNETGVCPECGEKIAHHEHHRAASAALDGFSQSAVTRRPGAAR